VCDGCPIHADVVVVAELQELVACKLGVDVGDDGVWYTIPMDNVRKAYSDLRLVIGRASINFENLLIANKNV
jgi:hypothetical protein